MPTELLTYVQETSLALWVSESPSLFGYPTILTMHTVGLAMLVGSSVAIDLRLLGVARAGALSVLTPFFRFAWLGLAINAASGVLLFIADAVTMAAQPVFWIKLLCIAGAVAIVVRVKSLIDVGEPLPSTMAPLAVLSLVLWTGAISAGRLMAYL